VLKGADLSRATLRAVRLGDGDLAGAALDGVDLTGLEWHGTRLDTTQALLVAEAAGVVVV